MSSPEPAKKKPRRLASIKVLLVHLLPRAADAMNEISPARTRPIAVIDARCVCEYVYCTYLVLVSQNRSWPTSDWHDRLLRKLSESDSVQRRDSRLVNKFLRSKTG